MPSHIDAASTDGTMRAALAPPSRAPVWIAAIAVTALLAIGARALVGGGGSAAETATPPLAPVSTAAPAVVDPPESRVAPQTSVVVTPDAHLSFIVSPSDAVVLIDGRPLAPDATGEILTDVRPDDLAMHELRVEARGFRSRIEDVRLSYAQRIVLSLDPGSGEDDRRASHRGPGTDLRRPPRSVTRDGPPPSSEHTPPPLLTSE